MAAEREPTHPPSDPRHPGLGPRGSKSRDDFSDAERPARLLIVGAILFGLLLVASGLYLWRRPRVSPDATAEAAPSSSLAVDDAGPPPPVEPKAPSPVTLSDPRVLGCHDRGSGKTPPDECDHLALMEKAFAHVIEQAATCVPDSASGGTIEYVADVSFARRKVRISLPRSGRSVHDRKVVRACAAAVREGMLATAFEGVDHRHSRYTISVTATYRGKNTPGSGPI